MTNDREHINRKLSSAKKIPQAQEAQSMQSRQQAGWQQHPLTLNHITKEARTASLALTQRRREGGGGAGEAQGGRKEEKEDKKRLSQ